MTQTDELDAHAQTVIDIDYRLLVAAGRRRTYLAAGDHRFAQIEMSVADRLLDEGLAAKR